MEWQQEKTEFADVIYEKAEGVARISINRPKVRNAFRVQTTREIEQAFMDAWHDDDIGVVVLTGVGDSFCSGGDVSERDPKTGRYRGVMWDGAATMVHYLIRNIPKPVIAAVNGYAIGGGQVFQQLCDIAIASEKAVFGQAGPRFGSFDAGMGSGYLARLVGERKAREIWFCCRRYTAKEALEMGLVNAVVSPDKLEEETMKWAKDMMELSPTALKFLKYSFNSQSDHLYGAERTSGAALRLFYSSEEAQEGTRAFLEKRKPNHGQFRKGL